MSQANVLHALYVGSLTLSGAFSNHHHDIPREGNIEDQR
jgi:hypothetical protein